MLAGRVAWSEPTPYQRAVALCAKMKESEKIGILFYSSPSSSTPLLCLFYSSSSSFHLLFSRHTLDMVHGHGGIPPFAYAGNIPANQRLSITNIRERGRGREGEERKRGREEERGEGSEGIY